MGCSRRVLRIVPLCVTAVAAACTTTLSFDPNASSGGVTIDGGTVDFADSGTTAPAKGCVLDVQPASLDFGTVLVAPDGGTPTAVMRSVDVTNRGTIAGHLVIKPTGASSSAYTIDPSIVDIAGGMTKTIKVSLTATTVADLSSPLGIDGGECGLFQVGMKAAGSDKGRVLTPSPIDFGSVACKGGSPAPKQFYIAARNEADAAVTATLDAPFKLPTIGGVVANGNGTTPIDVACDPLSAPAGKISRTLDVTVGTDRLAGTVQVTALGANIEIPVDTITITRGSYKSIFIANTGNAPISFTLTANPPFQVITNPISLDAAPNPLSKRDFVIGVPTNAGISSISTLGFTNPVPEMGMCVFPNVTLRTQ